MEKHDIERLAKAAIDCGFQVHDDVGPGLLETAYEAFLAALLAEGGSGWKGKSPVPLPIAEWSFAKPFASIFSWKARSSSK